ncbi:interleukin-17 receptor A [Electrophorus electricus]|uniref:interleukin-17 receptor A n=1 Tax=Electrophorus electricus TaxID=8005 RepID=UPI0015D0B8D0|nr:interleukin-17 receptor A [Electrophorus electricus]
MPNCSDDGWVKPRHEAPKMHPEVHSEVSVRTDAKGDIVPVLCLRLTQPSDGSIFSLGGSEVHVLEVATGRSLCIRCILRDRLSTISMSEHEPWSFVLDRIVIEPGLKYQISVSNLPKPDVGRHPRVQTIIVPGCEDAEFRRLRVCLENGSLWDPNLTWSVLDHGWNGGVVAMTFNTGLFSDLFRVAIHQPDIHSDLSLMVSKDNLTSISVNFSLEAWQLQLCDFVFVIKPFFVRCMNNCLDYQQNVHICSAVSIINCVRLLFISGNNLPPSNRHLMAWIVPGLAGLVVCAFMAVLLNSNSKEDMSSSSHDVTDKDEPKSILIQEPSKVLIIYSLDHPMYKDIVLKLCAFLRAKCGTDATLDLLDSSWISTIGRMQWLDMQRASLTRSSDKVLLLCSPGVQAKWKAMCRGVRVVTREDARTPMGDMLTPALSLITPDFMHVLSFQKYIVAYFEDICSERDIPAPFNVAVKYQLMKHFEEIFFRLLDKEKHEPGRIKHVEGIRGDEYHSCPSGRALRDAIEAFRAYQLVNPDWFEMEIVDADEDITLEQDEDVKINCNRVLQNELQVTEIVTRVVISEMTSPRHEPEESLTMVMHVVPT